VKPAYGHHMEVTDESVYKHTAKVVLIVARPWRRELVDVRRALGRNQAGLGLIVCSSNIVHNSQ
jgi:hypothetical protein